jgi:signal transduction histidine kinase
MPAASAVDLLWLDALQRICARSAHELKGALNGVSVNLEVVRSRAEKPDAAASAVRSFAISAADQFEIVIEMAVALLSLGREVRGPVEIASTVRHIVVLLEPAARADGRRLELEGSLSELGVTSAEGNAPRLAIGSCLLSAIDASPHVVCSGSADGGMSVVRIVSAAAAALTPPASSIVEAAADAGIHIQAERSAISIVFPP